MSTREEILDKKYSEMEEIMEEQRKTQKKIEWLYENTHARKETVKSKKKIREIISEWAEMHAHLNQKSENLFKKYVELCEEINKLGCDIKH